MNQPHPLFSNITPTSFHRSGAQEGPHVHTDPTETTGRGEREGELPRCRDRELATASDEWKDEE